MRRRLCALLVPLSSYISFGFRSVVSDSDRRPEKAQQAAEGRPVPSQGDGTVRKSSPHADPSVLNGAITFESLRRKKQAVTAVCSYKTITATARVP